MPSKNNTEKEYVVGIVPTSGVVEFFEQDVGEKTRELIAKRVFSLDRKVAAEGYERQLQVEQDQLWNDAVTHQIIASSNMVQDEDKR